MFFLLRMAFWLGVVCVLLPVGGKQADANIDPASAVSAASAAMSDMRGFCERQPQACVVGGKVAVAIGHKAEAGARTLYEFVTTKLNETPPAQPAGKSAAKEPAKTNPLAVAERGTLKSSDLAAPWHAPVPMPPPRRDARNGRPSV